MNLRPFLPLLLLLLLLPSLSLTPSCYRGSGWDPKSVAVVVADDAPEGIRWAADDLSRLLGEVTGATPPVVASASATSRTRLLLVGDASCPTLVDDAYAIDRVSRDGKSALRLCGDLLGTQYAVYELLAAQGVRFMHPEQTFVPRRGEVAIPAGGVRETPLSQRGFHLHTQHPIELLEAVLTDDPAEAERAQRYVDWLIANRQNFFQWILLDSIPEAEWKAQATRVVDYAHRRGVKVFGQTSFASEQQNAHRLVETSDAIDDLLQIREGIDNLRECGFDGININLGSSEFSETDPDETIAWMNEAARHAGSAHGVPIFVVNHVPADLYVPEYGVNFFDLPQFANPDVGVYVHTTMFYGLEGPAPVYGNADFGRQKSFLVEQSGDRPLVYYPESAWWLTFDNSIPLFLPIYIANRSADLNLVSTLPGVGGHVTFTSGWEWGYWLTDLSIARQSWAPAMEMDDVLHDLLDPLDGGGAADRVLAMADAQVDGLQNDTLMPFFAGEDTLTEIAYQAGIVFHPLAPSPSAVLSMPVEALDSLDATLVTLGEHCTALDAIVADWAPVQGNTFHDVVFPRASEGRPRPATSIGAAPLLEELRDGTRITALRCRNALAGYGALVAARRAALGTPTVDPAPLLAQARAATAEAQQIVLFREAAYRYEPERLSIDAGDVNVTDYDHRVHGRTHRLFFWNRRDDAIGKALDGVTGGLRLGPQQHIAGTTVTLDVSNAGFDEGSTVQVDWGDGAMTSLVVASGATATHSYPSPAQITFTLDALAEAQTVVLPVALSSATALYRLPKENVALLVPDSELASGAILAFVPDFQIGVNGTSGSAILTSLARDRDVDGEADFGSVVHLPSGTRTGDAVTIPGVELELPVDSGSGRIGTLYIRDAVFTWDFTDADATLANGRLAGAITVDEVVGVLVSTGVIDEAGALNILGDIFTFDPANPPATVEVELGLSGTRVAP